MKKALLLASLGSLAAACSDGIDYSAKTAPIGACGEVETHVIGIYDSDGEIVTIDVDRPGKHNIVVSAYAGTKWRINAKPGAQILKVYAVGYHEQLVAVPRGTKVIKDSADTTGLYACGFGAGELNGCDSDQLTFLASKIITHHVSSFHGCSAATKWHIGQNLATTANCSIETEQYDTLEGCIAYMNGENTCGDGGDDPPTDPNGNEEDGGPGTPGDGSGTDPNGEDGPEGENEGTGDAGPVFL